jgi:hypothetical protein
VIVAAGAALLGSTIRAVLRDEDGD